MQVSGPLCSRSRPRAVGVAVARYYDPATAQFLTRDPLEAETRDPYGYAGGDPVNASDPSGLDWLDDLGASVTGTFDGLTFGLTKDIRHGLGIDDSSITCSDVYKEARLGGQIDGTVASFLIPGGAFTRVGEAGRVFWTGEGAKAAATTWAAENGGRTIGMTRVGRVLERLPKSIPYSLTKPLWKLASANFARGASGYARVFIGPGGPSSSSIWATVERDILQGNGVDILEHGVG